MDQVEAEENLNSRSKLALLGRVGAYLSVSVQEKDRTIFVH